MLIKMIFCLVARKLSHGIIKMVEAAGIEPASIDPSA